MSLISELCFGPLIALDYLQNIDRFSLSYSSGRLLAWGRRRRSRPVRRQLIQVRGPEINISLVNPATQHKLHHSLRACELQFLRILGTHQQRYHIDGLRFALRVRLDRLESIAIEAAEQCGRTRLPEIAEPVTLQRFLADRDADRTLYFADEVRDGEPAAKALNDGPALILTGPEGGFTDQERRAIRAADKAVAISLGPRILRAETAALAALAAFMTVAGDWR